MRTVGQILKEERERKLLTIDEVEKATKIRKELLKALEGNDWSKLPPPTFIQGFIKNYGQFLKLDTEKLLAVFRREFSDVKNPPKIMDAWANPLQNPRFHLTPARVISAVVILMVVVFFTYLWFEYRSFVGGPPLEVKEPLDQASMESSTTLVSGKTDPESKITINNQEVGVDATGNFQAEIELNESVNKLSIKAISKFGQSTTVERTLYRK